MKKLFAILLVLTLVLSLSPAVMAAPDDGTITENGGWEENFYRGQPKTWNFTPTQTGSYLLFTPGSGSLIGQIVGQTPIDEYDVQSGQHIQVYSLTAGTTYQIQIEMNPDEPGDMVKDVFNIDRQKPLSLFLPGKTRLYFNKDDRFPVFHDQINFAVLLPVPSFKADHTFFFKKSLCDFLSMNPGFVSCLHFTKCPIKLFRWMGQGPISFRAAMCSAVPYPLFRANPYPG